MKLKMGKKQFLGKRRLFLLAGLAFFLVSSLTSFAQNVSVSVIDCNNKPAANVRVRVFRVVGGGDTKLEYDLRTDGSGNIHLPFRVPGGTYDLQIICSSGPPLTHQIYMSPAVDTAFSYVFKCCPQRGGLLSVTTTTPGGTTTTNFSPESQTAQSGGKQAAVPHPSSAVDFVHTGDWEPGDKVSFTVTGRVFNGTGEKESEAEFKGSVVKMTDSEGNKIHLPWSTLILFRVPQKAKWVKAELIKPDGSKACTADIPVNPPNTKPAVITEGRPSGNLFVPPVIQTGQPFKVYSLDGRLDGNAANSQLTAVGGKSSQIVALLPKAESPRCALYDPKGLQPGPQEITFFDPGAGQVNFTAHVLELMAATEKTYKVGSSGLFLIEAGPFPLDKESLEKILAKGLSVEILNKTPGILDFKSGEAVINWRIQKGEVKNGKARFKIPCKANKSGDFIVSSKIKTPPYFDATTGGGPFFAPGGKPCVNEGDLLHILSWLGGQSGNWWYEVEYPDGTKARIIIKTEKRPQELKKCQWIKVKKCAPDPDDPKGPSIIDEWELIDDPTKEPPQPPTPPTPPEETPPPPPQPPERPPDIVVPPPPVVTPPCQPLGKTRPVSVVIWASLIEAKWVVPTGNPKEDCEQEGTDCTAILQVLEFGAAGFRHVPTLVRFFVPGAGAEHKWKNGRIFCVKFRVDTTTTIETCTATGWVQSSTQESSEKQIRIISLDSGGAWTGTESPADMANAIKAARNSLGDPR